MYLTANFTTLIKQGWILRYAVMFYDISINHLLYYTLFKNMLEGILTSPSIK